MLVFLNVNYAIKKIKSVVLNIHTGNAFAKMNNQTTSIVSFVAERIDK